LGNFPAAGTAAAHKKLEPDCQSHAIVRGYFRSAGALAIVAAALLSAIHASSAFKSDADSAAALNECCLQCER
jgi:hypothetical protein